MRVFGYPMREDIYMLTDRGDILKHKIYSTAERTDLGF